MKKQSMLFVLLFLIFLINSTDLIPAKAVSSEVTVIYFYSSTCRTCYKLTTFFDSLQNKHNNFQIKKYNIADLKNEHLMEKYNEIYKVSESDKGIIPVVFVKNTYLTGDKAIRDNLENLIINDDSSSTIEIEVTDVNHESTVYSLMSIKTLSVFLAGLVNGINPCSMSMLLFFISLILVRESNIMKIGILFCFGKFVSYLFLGSILFKVFTKLNIRSLNIVIKIIMVIVIIILVLLNLQDFFMARKEKYNKIRVQLPTSLRKLNHSIIKRISSKTDTKLILVLSFVLGIIVSLGEFMCTGQIYLATIVTIIQISSTFSLQAFAYLLLYAFAFVIPLLIITFLIYKGKEVFEVSEVIREKLHVIKMVNFVVFIIFGFIVIFFY